VLAWGVKLTVGARHPLLDAIAVLGTFGVVYVAATSALAIPESRALISRLTRGPRRA
jgi:hypothetical protein